MIFNSPKIRTCFYLYLLSGIANSEGIQKPEPQISANDWQVSTLERQGINPKRFSAVESYIQRDIHKDIQSVSIVKNDKLVYEQYYNGSDYSTLHDIRSATKSIISALVGIAIDQGKIKSVNERIIPYFSDYFPIKHLNKNKESIRIIDLLTMSSGFDADVDDNKSKGNEDKMDMAEDWVRFAIDIPVFRKPGVKWSYASMNTFLLGYILEQATGEKLDVFAEKYLFSPLGIKNVQWRHTPMGRVVAQGNFKISARDMA